jgi:hypothetical protein
MPTDKQEFTWLLLMHQIQPKPEALRVKVWRALQRLGAAQIKNSVYAMPNIAYSRRVLLALAEEIEAGNGEAVVCEAKFLRGISSAALIERHNQRLQLVFKSLKKDLIAINAKLVKKRGEPDLMGIEHSLGRTRSLLGEATEQNAFGCAGEQMCRGLLKEIEMKLGPGSLPLGKIKTSYKKATWVTRADARVDRIASAWLIKRYIDPHAKFRFVNAKTYEHEQAHVRFDMFAAEFTHEGELCTFEVLLKKFKLNRPELACIGKIIHDLDIKDGKYSLPETNGVQAYLNGLAKRIPSDHDRIKEGFSFFENLAASLR